MLALALGASKYRLTRPLMGQSQQTNIIGGRHPLYEVSMSEFIPNDYGDNHEREIRGNGILVLTGPNHSGKSVYIKQVAIIIYLAHIGSFVPADVAEITVTDKILVCMSAPESTTTNESAFASDLKNISHVIKQATKNSFVAIDEFGKGTCPVNGAGLTAGLMEHFLQLGVQHCPRVIFATHFHEVFDSEPFDGYNFLQFAHMQVNINHTAEDEDSPLTYLFALQPGRSSSSFGDQCATLNGVPQAVVSRARVISSIIDRNEDLVATCATLTSLEKTQLASAEDVAREFLSYDLRSWSASEVAPKAARLVERLTFNDV